MRISSRSLRPASMEETPEPDSSAALSLADASNLNRGWRIHRWVMRWSSSSTVRQGAVTGAACSARAPSQARGKAVSSIGKSGRVEKRGIAPTALSCGAIRALRSIQRLPAVTGTRRVNAGSGKKYVRKRSGLRQDIDHASRAVERGLHDLIEEPHGHVHASV